MVCKICGAPSNDLFTTQILGKYPVKYYECSSCKFIQTEEPYWLEEAYASPINETDTGLLARNIQFLPLVSTLLYYLFGKKGMYVDYGGGYGVFTRLMRDVGFDYYWTDPKCENIHARGYVWNETQQPTAMTLFETFEHFTDPVMEVHNLLSISKNIIFSTTMAPTPAPEPNSWWYYGREHGQHVALYRPQTFKYLAKLNNTHYSNFGNLHVFSEKVILQEDAFLIRKAARFAFPLIKRFLKSKTHSDMQQLIRLKTAQ